MSHCVFCNREDRKNICLLREIRGKTVLTIPFLDLKTPNNKAKASFEQEDCNAKVSKFLNTLKVSSQRLNFKIFNKTF